MKKSFFTTLSVLKPDIPLYYFPFLQQIIFTVYVGYMTGYVGYMTGYVGYKTAYVGYMTGYDGYMTGYVVYMTRYVGYDRICRIYDRICCIYTRWTGYFGLTMKFDCLASIYCKVYY